MHGQRRWHRLPAPNIEHSEAARYTIDQKEHRMSDVTILATGLGFPEGPVVCHDGSVVLTEIRHGRCTRVTPDGSTSVFSHTGGGPNGLAIGPDGAFYLGNNAVSQYVAHTSMGHSLHPDYTCGFIQRINPHTGEHTTLYTAC